jgi:hydrogenase expression/formation protein HypC
MCLGIPMRIESIDGLTAQCEAKGVRRTVGLLMLQHEHLASGDYLMVHLGQAIDKVSREEALAAWAIYDEMFALLDGVNQR